MTEEITDQTGTYSRRQMLFTSGSIASILGVGGLTTPFEDKDNDGIPDEKERSAEHQAFMDETFGSEQFGELDPSRKDLLIDARYVGSASIADSTKSWLERTFRQRGIHLQWLDYPRQYDRDRFANKYHYQIERILWPYFTFYHEEVEDDLKNTALQVVVVPEASEELDSFYTVHRGEHYKGVSLGNRCLVTEQDDLKRERVLLLHEIGHLALGHDDDPANEGVMGPDPTEATLTEAEWQRVQGNLENIRDRTGFDMAFRPCILEESLEDLAAGIEPP